MASAAPPNKRQSTAVGATSTAPKPQCNIHASATVADKAQLIGPHLIEIGENSLIHPYGKVSAAHGNVIIGKSCIIAEKALVGPSEAIGEAGCMLGDGVSIETGAVVNARRIGDHSTIEVNAKVGSGSVIGKWCKVGALCEVIDGEVLEDYTVIFGNGERRSVRPAKETSEISEMKVKGRRKEVELLRSLIPDSKVKWMS